MTGFLGSGNATLLNRILRERHGRKLAVIVGEFGEISLDGQLVEFNNGRLCCTVRGGLVETLGRLQPRAGTLEGILIATAGFKQMNAPERRVRRLNPAAWPAACSRRAESRKENA
ncbi:MAG TPA: GTP-binding protein [Acetobacteraceae bacterium]|nr:GTP-binding protein [Acetobacteraceae bacterium]